jgi:hypothetical protein
LKTILSVPTHPHFKPRAIHFPALLLALALAATPVCTVQAADDTQPAAQPATNAAAVTTAAPAEKPAPLPLHEIEGNGGIFSTLSAYIVNPPRDGEPVGRPSVGFAFVDIGHGQNLEALTLTESPFKRVELGFGYNNLDLGDLPQAILRETTVNITRQNVQLYNFNGRVELLTEGEFDQKWLPALTVGAHYKHNDGLGEIDDELGGALSKNGLTHHDGVDSTLYASKLITQLPRPVLLELGGRVTSGVWNGLGGFTSKYSFLFEGNVVVFVTSKLALAAEYREQPDEYKPVGNLVRSEGDWWTLDAAYVVNNHLTLALGYGHFGGVLDHDANGVWGLTTKWEF